MAAIGRIGDIGIGTCYCHKHPTPYVTNIISGASTVLINGLSMAQVGSIGIASCGHPTIALTNNSSVTSGALGVHRVGDMGRGCSGSYTLITGSSNTTG